MEKNIFKCNTLLEGKPRVGKTTLLLKVSRRISHYGLGGFYTEEIRKKNRRVGFRISTFSGQTGILAHVDYTTGPRVGKYRVNIPTLERIGVRELERALQDARIILIDEIGKMELFSDKFKEILLRCLDSSTPILATIMLRSNPFADTIKKRPDVELIQVTLKNRDRLPDKLISEFIQKFKNIP